MVDGHHFFHHLFLSAQRLSERTVFGPRADKVAAGLEDTVQSEALRFVRLTKHYSSDLAETNEMGGA
jgi:hypothetical protein